MIKIVNNRLFIDNDDHVFYIERLYDKDDLEGKDLFNLLMINAYRTPVSDIVNTDYICKNVFSYELNRYLTINDLNQI